MKSKIHDMHIDDVLALVKTHGQVKAAAMLKVGKRVMAIKLAHHQAQLMPSYTRKDVLQRMIMHGATVPQMAIVLDCHTDTVYKWLNHHKLRRPSAGRYWQDSELKYLAFNAHLEPWPVIASYLNRTVGACKDRAKKLHIESAEVIGYSIADVANDVHMTITQVHGWHAKLGMPVTRVASTTRAHVDPTQFADWLAQGNVLRITHIEKCAHWLKEMYANAQDTYISNAEILHYCTHVMHYARQGKWPNRFVPLPVLWLQRNGMGYIYKRCEIREWLTHYRYTLPPRIDNTMPNWQWWQAFAGEWDSTYIYSQDLLALLSITAPQLMRFKRLHLFPKSMDTYNAYYQRDAVIYWIKNNPRGSAFTKALRNL